MTNPASPTLRRVLKAELCAGCGLCASVSGGAVHMRWSPRGYRRPVQTAPLGSKAEEIIASSCPGAVLPPWPANSDPFWGPAERVFTARAQDEAVQHAASSGGALTVLLAHALDASLVDRVIHVAASPTDPAAAEVTCSRSARDVIAGAGSRYVASSPLAAIEEVLAEGGLAAFVGKPCDVSALRRLGAHDRRVERHIRYALSFFCAGVPSRQAIRRMLAAMDVTESELTALRYRGHGWPGNIVAVTQGGRKAEMSYEEGWGSYLSKDVQFRCKICADAVGGVADVSCADAWRSDPRGYPLLKEQGNGQSLVLARTPAGKELIDGAVAAGALLVESIALKDIHSMQPAQARRKRLVGARMAGLRAVCQPRPVTRGVGVEAAAATASTAAALKDFLGSIRRVVTYRR